MLNIDNNSNANVDDMSEQELCEMRTLNPDPYGDRQYAERAEDEAMHYSEMSFR